MQIGIDTSVIVGLLDSRDIWHTPSVSLQEAITAAGLEPILKGDKPPRKGGESLRDAPIDRETVLA